MLQLNGISVPKSLSQRDKVNQRPTTALESQLHPFLASTSSVRVLTDPVKAGLYVTVTAVVNCTTLRKFLRCDVIILPIIVDFRIIHFTLFSEIK